MRKNIEVEVRPKFLMVTRDSGYTATREFDSEKDLRAACLEELDEEKEVTCYRVTARADAGRHHALDMRWR